MTASNSTGRIRFAPGQIVITANAAGLLAPDEVASALARHLTGDWGTVCADDAEANEEALIHAATLKGIRARALALIGRGEEDETATPAGEGMGA